MFVSGISKLNQGSVWFLTYVLSYEASIAVFCKYGGSNIVQKSSNIY